MSDTPTPEDKPQSEYRSRFLDACSRRAQANEDLEELVEELIESVEKEDKTDEDLKRYIDDLETDNADYEVANEELNARLASLDPEHKSLQVPELLNQIESLKKQLALALEEVEPLRAQLEYLRNTEASTETGDGSDY